MLDFGTSSHCFYHIHTHVCEKKKTNKPYAIGNVQKEVRTQRNHRYLFAWLLRQAPTKGIVYVCLYKMCIIHPYHGITHQPMSIVPITTQQSWWQTTMMTNILMIGQSGGTLNFLTLMSESWNENLVNSTNATCLLLTLFSMLLTSCI